jgi:hypothetical protein
LKALQSSILRIAPVWATAACVAAACSPSLVPSIEYQTRGKLPVTADGLHRIHSMQVAAVYLKPGASFADDRQIVIDPVTVSYKSPPRRPTAGNPSGGNFGLSQGDMARLGQGGAAGACGRPPRRAPGVGSRDHPLPHHPATLVGRGTAQVPDMGRPPSGRTRRAETAARGAAASRDARRRDLSMMLISAGVG